MGVKKIVTDRLDRARSFAENVRAVYADAYKKAVEASKDIEPKLRSVLDGGLDSAKITLDNLNQSLADKAIPAFRKRAVSKEKLDHKAKEVVKEAVAIVEPIKKKRAVKKAVPAKKKNTSTSSHKKTPARK